MKKPKNNIKPHRDLIIMDDPFVESGNSEKDRENANKFIDIVLKARKGNDFKNPS